MTSTFAFEPEYIGDRSGPQSADDAMQERRRAMDLAGASASAGATTAAWNRGPGQSEWVLPAERNGGGAIFFVHGSGLSKGSPASHRPLTHRIANAAGLPVLIPDYRLTPEHRYPAALIDAVDAYRAVLDEYESNHVGFLGDSAGGGLALATALAARDAGLPLPACVATISAWTDLAVTGEPRPDVDDPRVTSDMLRSAAALYLDGADPYHPYASPLYGDFSGFPPILMQVGGREIMIEDTARLAARARLAGVDVREEVYPGMTHVFPLNEPQIPDSERAIQSVATFMAKYIIERRRE